MMTRAYAIAVCGGTQALVLTLWSLGIREADALAETWLVAAAFAINLAVAELLIRRRPRRRSHRAEGRHAVLS